MKPRRLSLVVFLAVLFLPRVLAIDSFTLLDEPRWVVRAGEYLNAFQARQWTALYSPGYPGIPNLVTLAPVVSEFRESFDENRDTVEGWTLRHRQQVLAGSRVAIGVLTGALGVWLFALLRHTALFQGDDLIPAALTLVILSEPWLLGMSRTVLLDAPLSLFLLVAITAAAAARERGSQRAVIASGAAWGLAFLTKTPALFFVPLILLPLLQRPLHTVVRPVLHWLLAALATILALWPALWTNPVAQLADLLFWSQDQVVHYEPHYWPGWHPPFVFVALSLPLLVGLGWYLWSRFRELRTGAHQRGIFFADLALLGGLLFQLLMEAFIADRSRWILPALTFLAVPGMVGAFRLLTAFRLRPRLAALVLAAGQAAYTAAWFPFLTLHLNPLFRTEPATWQFGMGEGYREVAHYLDGVPGNLLVATKAPGSLQSYLADPSRVQLTRFPRSGNLDELPKEVTHIVVPWGLRNRTRLSYDPSAARTFAWVDARTPLYRVSIRGVPLYGIFPH